MEIIGSQNFNLAMAYIEKVKGHFKDSPEMYAQFLQIMKEHHEQTGANNGTEKGEIVKSTRAKLDVLFKDYPDLLEEFEKFVPEEHKKQTDETAAA